MKDAEAKALLAEHENRLEAAVDKMRPLVAEIENLDCDCNSARELRIALNCHAVAFSALLTILVDKGALTFKEFMAEHEWAMDKELQDYEEMAQALTEEAVTPA